MKIAIFHLHSPTPQDDGNEPMNFDKCMKEEGTERRKKKKRVK